MNHSKPRADIHIRREQQAREGEKAWAEYQAKAIAVRERTRRLRELRLAQAADAPALEAATETKAGKAKRARSKQAHEKTY